MAMSGLHLLVAVVAAVLLGRAGTAADSVVSTWSTCGGSQFCPCGMANCDSQWVGVSTWPSDACSRKDSTWWRSEPRSSVCWARTADTWSPCGGKDNCPSGTATCDAPWPGWCCKHGDVCARENANWWRCKPADQYANSNTCTDFAATWASCSSAKRICCSNPGDVCVSKGDQWARCEPSWSNGRQSAGAPPRGIPPPPLKTDGGNQIVRVDNGQTVKLHGINWFCFNVARSMVDGLGHGGADAQTDFATIVRQLKLLGYNLVRLPFRYRDLDIPNPKTYEVGCWTMSQEDLRRRLMEPGFWTDKQLPSDPAAVQRPNGMCNTYLPSSSTYDRLMFTIQAFVAQGMYVMLDYQPMGTEQQALDPREFVCKWRNVMARVMGLNNWSDDIKGRVLVDIMNEPDSMGIRWEATNGKPGATDLYLSTMDALHSMSRDGWLYVVEGTGQNNFGLNWGNGFITDNNLIWRYGLSNANPFFSALMGKQYVDRVIISPHVYPPSVTKGVFLGDTLWQQSHAAFGYLQTQGYCSNQGSCKKFPVVIGETGSFLADDKDRQWMADFGDYVQARGGARSHNNWPMAGWLWWCYNENSGDTGGIVYDNWSRLDWHKLSYQMWGLGLTPWYKW